MIRNIWHKLFRKKTFKSSLDLHLEGFLLSVLNIKTKDIALYKQAFSHSSISKRLDTNGERLEYLGDAILGAIVAAELHKRYPSKTEGQLSTMRSKIVSRKQLNKIGKKLKLNDYIIASEQGLMGKSVLGNTLESLIGAIYLDCGWDKCYRIILEQIFSRLDMHSIENSINSYKSYVLEWAQKTKANLKFETVSESGEDHNKSYVIALFLNNQEISSAEASSKKKAEELAAKIAYSENHFQNQE